MHLSRSLRSGRYDRLGGGGVLQDDHQCEAGKAEKIKGQNPVTVQPSANTFSVLIICCMNVCGSNYVCKKREIARMMN